MKKRVASKRPGQEHVSDILPDLKAALIKSAHAAGRVLLKYYEMPLQVREKIGAGLVTEADLAAEKAVIKILGKARPDFRFLSEEGNPEGSPGTSRGRWIIDPLDGTTNFVHRFPMFCVSVAAEWDGNIVAGVIYHPVLKETYVATLGGGAFVNGKRMHVSTRNCLRDSLLTTGFSYRKEEILHAEMTAFERLSLIARAIRRPGSAALDLAYTARGVFEAFWERRLSPWDVAAGALLVSEAGGRVTDFSGNPFRVEKREILASNSLLHEEIRNIIAPELCSLDEED
jgi:myo-inositol-1(or 4)-monophosphatase